MKWCSYFCLKMKFVSQIVFLCHELSLEGVRPSVSCRVPEQLSWLRPDGWELRDHGLLLLWYPWEVPGGLGLLCVSLFAGLPRLSM